MTTYEITEIGNGPWCDPIEAASIDAALQVVAAELHSSWPGDYVDEYTEGDELPTVDVIIRETESGEEIRRTMTVGQ